MFAYLQSLFLLIPSSYLDMVCTASHFPSNPIHLQVESNFLKYHPIPLKPHFSGHCCIVEYSSLRLTAHMFVCCCIVDYCPLLLMAQFAAHYVVALFAIKKINLL